MAVQTEAILIPIQPGALESVQPQGQGRSPRSLSKEPTIIGPLSDDSGKTDIWRRVPAIAIEAPAGALP